MSFSSWSRAGALLTFGLVAASCSENLTPDKKVSFIEISPKSARLYTVGQQQQFETVLTTEAGTDGVGIAVGYKSREESLVQVNSSGVATAKKSGITTKDSFGDCQLHVEFATPAKVEGNGQGRGNSGVARRRPASGSGSWA